MRALLKNVCAHRGKFLQEQSALLILPSKSRIQEAHVDSHVQKDKRVEVSRFKPSHKLSNKTTFSQETLVKKRVVKRQKSVTKITFSKARNGPLLLKVYSLYYRKTLGMRLDTVS